jgi:hypothetical protein
LIWPGQDRFVAITKMAESGRIAARKLRGTFRRTVAGAGFRKVSTIFCPPRRHAREPRPCAAISPSPAPVVAGLDATEDATIDLVND